MLRLAQGRLSFARSGARTVVRDAYAESPLRLLTPRNHGDSAWAYTSTLGGGFVDGDRVRLRVRVEEGARAFLSTQGPTRIYRSPHGCESEIVCSVADGGALVLAPEPTACFAGARYRQRTEVDLSGSGSVALWDVLSAGRSARGERWAFQRCALGLSVRRSGRALVDDCWLLDPAHGALGDRLGRFEALATVLLAGPLFAPLREAFLRTEPPGRRERLLESASALDGEALVARLAAASVEELSGALRARLAGAKALLGDDPWARRA
ncbi:MAG TPA: urease accessory protein UreD [Myxococcales bacterium]|nr:urease accessory protein UreD [Myxococcales bacterium]